MRYLIGLLIVAVLGVFFGMNCGEGGEGTEESRAPTTNEEFNDMLDGLGFTTEIGRPVDPYGEPLEEGYHPLGRKFAAFNPTSELYVAGFEFPEEPDAPAVPEHILDDSSTSYAPLEFSSKLQTDWTSAMFKNGIGADVDGDGLDEFLVVYYAGGANDEGENLEYILIDPSDGSHREGVIDPSASSIGLEVDRSVVQPAMAAGDVDGDDQDEVFVAFGKLYILDDLADEPTVSSKAYPDQNDVFVAAGNLDLDAEDELVVTYTETAPTKIGRYEIYDGSLESPAQTDVLKPTVGVTTYDTKEAQVAIGDVDGDRLGEIVFFGILTDGNRWALFIMEFQGPEEDPIYDWRQFYDNPFGWASADIPQPLVTLDTDGDYRHEIYAHHSLFEVTDETTPEEVTYIGGRHGNYWYRVAAGDMDGDGRDDLVYEWADKVTVWGRGTLADTWLTKKQWSGARRHPVIVATGNIDKDSAIVRYDGDYELLFTDPLIVAAMASPPYHAGIDQNLDETASTFGKIEGTTVEEETALGFSTGFSVGYETSFFGLVGAEFTLTVEQSLDFTAAQSTTIEKYHSYTSGPGEDKVVFTTVPFDVYYYTVVSSPVPDEVGRTMTINIPRDTQTLATSVEFYNANNGASVDVDENVFEHTVGDVWSYPSVDDKNRLLLEAEANESSYKELWNGPKQVSEGTGFDTIGISESEGSARGAQMDLNVTTEFVATAGGAKAGTSVGFHYGYGYSVSTEETAFFEGTIGNIEASSYTPDNIYQYGLMVYPEHHADQKFVVMHYWVQR